jgi:6-phosphogluconolactonase (cycloisomerase 2 family)
VADQNSNDIDAFAIPAVVGVLGYVPGAPFAAAVGPTGLVANPSGSALYTLSSGANPGDNRMLSAFTINSANGALTPVAGTPISVPATSYMTIDPQGKYLIIAGALGVYVYPLDADTGALGTAVAGSPFTAGVTSTYDPYSVSVDPSGKFIYVCDAGRINLGSGSTPVGAIDEFALDSSTGMLTPVVGSPVAAGTNPAFIAFK